MTQARVARVLGLLGAFVLLGSCERAPVAPVVPAAPGGPAGTATSDTTTGDWGWLTGLLRCQPLPHDSTAQVIGPDGGSLSVGPHTFTVPPGALAAPTLITAVVDSVPVNQIRFTPQGLTFAQPASLVMSYANCNLFGLLVPKRIAYTTDDLQILELIPSLDDVFHRRVTGQVSHFSQYAIAW